MVAAAVVVVAAEVAAVVVAAVAVAHAHDHLGRLGRPCLMQARAKCPFGSLPGGALRTHSELSLLSHPQEPLPMQAAPLPPALQPVQLLPICPPPAILPGHSRSDLQRSEEELH